MKRSLLLTLPLALLLLLAGPASAVEVVPLGPTSGLHPGPGGTLTLDLAVENASGDAANALLIELSGLAAHGAIATSGQAAHYTANGNPIPVHFTGLCTTSQCFGGLPSIDNSFYDPTALESSTAYTPGDDSIVLIYALSTAASSESGANDPGLDGPLDAPSARDATITLQFAQFSGAPLTIGGIWSDGTSEMELAPIQYSFVPEPGIALLLGLGLAGVASGRRTRRTAANDLDR